MASSSTETTTDAHKMCMSRLEGTVANHRIVHTLLDSISSLGCKLPKDFFVCRNCDADMTGGFMLPPRQPPTTSSSSSSNNNNKNCCNGSGNGSGGDSDEYQPRIVLCEDKKIDRQTFDNTIIHELIHAYDVCRAKIDWKKCEQHACTEIRASALSGECGMSRELLRGQYNIRGGHRECVKRRASKSLAANVYCKDSCSDAIEAAFEQCYADVKPFTHPRG